MKLKLVSERGGGGEGEGEERAMKSFFDILKWNFSLAAPLKLEIYV